MSEARIFTCAGVGLALATLSWFIVAVEGMSAGIISRSAGLALFTVAMLAAGLVFRAAMRASKLEPARAASATSEFRRGFAKHAKASKPGSRAPSQQGVVVALRRATEEAQRQPAMPAGVNLSPDQIERLRGVLHARAAAIRARDAEQAKRQLLHSDVDVHGLAGS